MNFFEWLHSTRTGVVLVDCLRSIRVRSLDISLYSLMYIFCIKVYEDDTLQRAQSVAFNFTLTILPSIIFAFTLIPYLPVEGFEHMIFEFIDDMMPVYVTDMAKVLITDIVSRRNGGLMSFGFVLATYMATSGMRALMGAFNSCYHEEEHTQGWVLQNIKAFTLTGLMAFTLFSAIILLVYGKAILTAMVQYSIIDTAFVYGVLYVLRFLIMGFLFFMNISSIYHLAPVVRGKWRVIYPGAVLATLLGILVSLGFSFYLDNFNTYNQLYGSIGAVIGIMFWLLAVSYIILLGFQFNNTLELARDRLRIFEQNTEKKEERFVL